VGGWEGGREEGHPGLSDNPDYRRRCIPKRQKNRIQINGNFNDINRTGGKIQKYHCRAFI
jgi:hypothetical protein